jgi:hypothetical protein
MVKKIVLIFLLMADGMTTTAGVNIILYVKAWGRAKSSFHIVTGESSKWFKIKSGVPQGSIL